jgi:malate synthase
VTISIRLGPTILVVLEDPDERELIRRMLGQLGWRIVFAVTEDDAATGIRAGDPLTRPLFDRLLREEYDKLLAANPRDVHEPSKRTTLPIAREIVETYVTSPAKLPWYVDLLNLNLDNEDLAEARRRIAAYLEAFGRGERLTGNQSFGGATPL